MLIIYLQVVTQRKIHKKTFASRRMKNTKKKMRNLITYICIIVCIGISMPSYATELAKGRKPNVVIILADDFGWKDAVCYGSTYLETPNIDRLASEGMRFTEAYSANPLCSPTRASILTGKNPDRTGITSPWCHLPKADP